MKSGLQYILVVLAVVLCVGSSTNWAVLVAGSNSWFNYRHQADVFHAYQVVLKKGIKPENIIVLAYDDIANNTRNPFPGKVYNKPTYEEPGKDVYEGVKIDYSGKDVTPEVFMKVLEGKKNDLKGVGTGRVLESTSSDNVFMFFSDHGAPGIMAFPSTYLYANQLIQTFENMKGRYRKFVFYLETCESGSMFQKLATDTKIYALSAANPTESSYGTYCSPNDIISGKHIGSCLGDLFSVNFIEDTEDNDVSKYTLDEQFTKIRTATTMSHVMQWGDVSFTTDKVSEFLGVSKRTEDNSQIFNLRKGFFKVSDLARRGESSIDSRLMKVKILGQIFERERSKEAYSELREEMQSMQRFDNIFAEYSTTLKLTGRYSSKRLNFECLKSSVDTFEERCGKFTDYGLRYVKYLAEACERYVPSLVLNEIKCHERS